MHLLDPFRMNDERGVFVKTFNFPHASLAGLGFSLREEFYSVSHKDVIRGLHFQTPPHSHQKLVYCVNGGILDVLVDLRKSEPTYGMTISIELSARNHLVLWIPVGVGHGFLSLEDNSCVIYKTDFEYSPASDHGILWSSIDFDWGISAPTLSERDSAFPLLKDFDSPF
jgi:dTDP-4-dehydrorhamnose 3,5-epimerase